ncbi:MAG: DUF4411 family protein [Candidatus Hydrogenedentes bacterium]|nr:DUF4411 family protein [Candidatus Hydrogenedentota bacterium]
MIYVFDTSSFRVVDHYFPDRFPSFWERFDEAVSDGIVVSVREVRNELDRQSRRPHLEEWIGRNRSIFLQPSSEEMDFVAQVFAIPHFQHLVKAENLLKGMPVADPFVIASAKCRNGCVVTEESRREHAARIPNVCEHFGIDCTNVDGFMAREGWEF